LVSKDEQLRVKRQCELLEVNRSSYYYEPSKPTDEEIKQEEYIKGRLD
jgi:putative transposase